MKKLFFFRSSNNGNSSPSTPSSVDRQLYWEKPFEDGAKNQDSSDKSVTPAGHSVLRRSRSLSSGAFHGQNGFASPSSSSTLRQPDHSPRGRALTPKCQSENQRFESEVYQNGDEVDKHHGSVGSFGSLHDLSGSSSYSSSTVSTKIIDRYIDGEQQHQQSNKMNNHPSRRTHTGNGNNAGRRPPRVQYSAPVSPKNSTRDKPRSTSFRDATHIPFSSKEWTEDRLNQVSSPRKLAKNVIEKLSQCHGLPNKTSSKSFISSGNPITTDDIYGVSSRCSNADLDGIAKICCPSLQKLNPEDRSDDMEEDIDVELRRKLKQADERVMLLSEELGEESFLRDPAFNVSGLVNTIRNLNDERMSLALEVSSLIGSRITERASVKEELRSLKNEMGRRIQSLEKEKNDLQSGLEKELDRRSSDWSLKLEKYKSEEQRLRDRVRELAEQNVSLQREVSNFNETEIERRNMMASSEQQLKDLSLRVDNITNENQNLRQNLTELQEMYRGSEEDRECVHRNYEEKDKEVKALHKSLIRLLRTCGEQEKTIEILREGLSDDITKKQSVENLDKRVEKLQVEQLRLIGVEQALRKEVQSYHFEVNTLRNENVGLLNRLRANIREGGGGCLTVKLDEEILNRVSCLQNQGLLLLKESTYLCSKLLEFNKRKSGQIREADKVTDHGLDGAFLMEYETKLQGLKRGTESLTRSLQNISTLLHEKSNLLDMSTSTQSNSRHDDLSAQLPNPSSEDSVKSKLKAETLLTSLLREKLYAKELEVEKLQGELATAVRVNDILRCEVQNAMDNLSCASHKLKDFELKMLKKDENMSRMQSDLQESTKELTIKRGILPKVSEERDLMWAEVKQYSEENMLLNREVNELKKKIETLDEIILVKEGEVAILKDTLEKRPFDDYFLSSPDFTRELESQSK